MHTHLLPTLILLSLLLTACGSTVTPAPTPELPAESSSRSTVSAEGTLLPAPSVELAFAQGGIVKQVLARPGRHIAQGDVIARLVGIETVQAELAAAQLEVELAHQALDSLARDALLSSSKVEQDLLDAQKAYESASSRWDMRQDATDLDRSLDDYITVEQDYTQAREELDELLDKAQDDRERLEAQEDFELEKANLEKAYADVLEEVARNEGSLEAKTIDLLKAIGALEAARQLQSRLDDSNLDTQALAIAQARLEAAQAHVAAAEGALELYELRAPLSGVLLRLDLQAGEAVAPLAPVAFLADTSHWTVETKDLAEIDIALISVGDAVAVKLDAFPGEEFSGTVQKIDPVGREYLGDMTYQVTIVLDEPDPRFLWNMTATVTIYTDGEE